MKRIAALNSNTYHGFTIEQAIDGTARAGFHAIELTATKGWTEHVFPTDSFHRLCEIRMLLEQRDLEPVGMSGHCNLMDENRLGDFVDNLQLAAFFGCRYLVSSIGEAHLKDEALASNQEVASRVADLVPLLEKNHLTLVLENHGDHGTGAILREIVGMVDHPLVRINYDTANAVFYGKDSVTDGASMLKDLSGCAGDVAYMHLKDKAGAQKEWNFPAPGKGMLPLKEALGILESSGNSCPVSVEIEFTPAGPKDLCEVDQAAADAADFLRSQGIL